MALSVTFNPGTTFPTGFEQLLLNEINQVRMNPQSYIPYLSLERYRDYPLSERQETANFLNRQRPCTVPLRINTSLNRMAQTWVNTQGRTQQIGHGNLSQRLDQANIGLIDGSYRIAENIAYGFVQPRDIVLGWIIDYNVPGKGHRTNLFNCELDQIGIGYGPHQLYRVMVVNEYGRGFI